MLCHHCGFEAEDTVEFCEACGASLHTNAPEDAPRVEVDWALLLDPEPEETPQPERAAPPEETVPPAGARAVFLKRRGKFLLPAALALAAVVTLAVVLLWSSPERLLGTALAGLSAEVGTRVDGTPLHAFGILAECLENGQTTIDFDYEDYYMGGEYHLNTIISTDMENERMAAETVFSFAGKALDFDILLNNERLAMQSSLLGEEYYGFRYDTAREEIEHFLSLLGVEGLRAEVCDALDSLSETGEFYTAYYERYSQPIADFLAEVKLTSRKVDAPRAGASPESCTAIDIHVTGDRLIRLYEEYVTLMETDERFRAQYEIMLQTGVSNGISDGMSYDEMIAELRRSLDELPEGLTAGITATFVIDRRGRLANLTVWMTAELDGETGEAGVVLDFGASVADPWTLTFVSGDALFSSTLASWAYEERTDRFENRMEFYLDGEAAFLDLAWSRENGWFAVSFDDGYDVWGLTGVLTMADGGFDLMLDDIYAGDSAIGIGISARRGAEVGDPEYISLGTLGQDFVEKLQMAVLTFLLS